MLIVAGAGNGGQIGKTPANFVYPAAERFNSDDNVFSVGASTPGTKRLATFSTMGNAGSGDARWVRFVAPGENIVSALPGGRYGVWSGTSMAAPIVSGIVGIVVSVNKGIKPTQLLEQMEEFGGAEWGC